MSNMSNDTRDESNNTTNKPEHYAGAWPVVVDVVEPVTNKPEHYAGAYPVVEDDTWPLAHEPTTRVRK